MKIIKKILLVILGILLSLIILEIGLQIAGFTATTIKKYKNKVTKDSNTITILCLGESTTYGQWPPILQKILDEKSKNKKFNVIDEGLPGTSTRKIAERIVDTLIKHDPDIVITMMGINDQGLMYKNYKIKTLALFSLIFSHIKQLFYYTDEDIKYFDRMVCEMPYDKKLKIAYKFYKKGVILYHLFSILVQPVIENKVKDENKLQYINKISDIVQVVPTYDIIDIIEMHKLTEEQIKNFIIKNKHKIIYEGFITYKILETYGLLHLVKDMKNNRYRFDFYKNVKKSKSLNKKNTKKNYQYIISEIYKNNKKVIVLPMQYPTLSVEELKQGLKDSKYYNKLIFVSNEENFKRALEKNKADKIFRDMFGGSFGHCTEYGNTLIAKNIAETILKLYN